MSLEEKQMNDDVKEALNAVRNIRASIKGNISLVRPLFMDRSYVPLCLIASLGMVILSIWVILTKIYWTTNGIAESWTRYVYIGFLILLFVLATVWKFLLIKRFAKENSSTTLKSFLRLPEIFNLMFDSTVCLITLAILCLVLSYKMNSFWVFLPGSFLYIGVVSIICGNMYSIAEYRISGIVTFIFSMMISIFMKSDFYLWLSSSYCIYFLSLAMIVHLTSKGKK